MEPMAKRLPFQLPFHSRVAGCNLQLFWGRDSCVTPFANSDSGSSANGVLLQAMLQRECSL